MCCAVGDRYSATVSCAEGLGIQATGGRKFGGLVGYGMDGAHLEDGAVNETVRVLNQGLAICPLPDNRRGSVRP
jgi:hypothetical protein